jgi:pimeloyl-ACP methyl ester carboxylesterase
MSEQRPTVVLVHGAFAGSSSWDGVVERLLDETIDVTAVANPLRSLAGDAAYVRDVVANIGGRVILVGHSYGGMVITEAAADNAVIGLVYVCAFAPEHGETALGLSGRFPGSTLGDAVEVYPLSAGGNEVAIRHDAFRRQFAADVPAARAAVMAARQRPVTERALLEGLPSERPAWARLPSWFVFGDQDRSIPVEMHRFMAERAAARSTTEVAGGSHALSVSDPDAVTACILGAVAGTVRATSP